jgi:hypothetical protein
MCALSSSDTAGQWGQLVSRRIPGRDLMTPDQRLKAIHYSIWFFNIIELIAIAMVGMIR